MNKEIIRPIVDEIKKNHEPQPPSPPEPPLQPAELDQDPGGGYNTNRTYPQT